MERIIFPSSTWLRTFHQYSHDVTNPLMIEESGYAKPKTFGISNNTIVYQMAK